jgi:hypothetical protein
MTPSKIPLARLYEKTSKNGTRYFTGRMGQARVLLFRDREQPADGDQVWSLMLEAVEPEAGQTAARSKAGLISQNTARSIA